MRRLKKTKYVLLRKLPKGTRVRLLRPNLWAEMKGVVTGSADGVQLVRITRVDGASFEAGAHYDEMEVLK